MSKLFDEKPLGLTSIGKPDTVLGRGTWGGQRQRCCPQDGNSLRMLRLVIFVHLAGMNVAMRKYSQRRKRNCRGRGSRAQGVPGGNNEARRGDAHWRACCR